jgi:glyoxylase-like metal-dependent hydrolase (beta-lactamase superfamily II)
MLLDKVRLTVILRETFPAGRFQCNCTVLACGDTKQAIVIDPGGEVAKIAEIVAHYDLTVGAIIHTHAHLDHIYCTRDIKDAHGGAICLHRGDAFLYDGFAVQAQMFGWPVTATRPVERWIEHGDVVAMGKHELAVIHTPGHTPGSVCFAVGELLFAGDTLFRGSVGRTDLPGGDSKQLAVSIRERLYTRDLDTQVIPGHGPQTVLGDEAINNPFVRLTT